MIEETVKRILNTPENHELVFAPGIGADDLRAIARAYDENVLAPQRALAKYQVYIEWMKRLSRDPTTKMPVCNCGSVIPEPYLEPEKRPEFLKWCEEHYVNGTNEARTPQEHIESHLRIDCDWKGCPVCEGAKAADPTADIQEFIAAYHDLRKFTLQFEDVFERSHMIYLKACKLLEESEKKIANEPVTAEVIEINNAFINSTAYPDGGGNENQ